MNEQIRYKMMYKDKDPNLLIGYTNNMKAYQRTVVCIKIRKVIYKILSINATSDGSINIFFPYCKRSDGKIIQHQHDYKVGISHIGKNDIIKECVVNNNTKLSLHNSGFAQLSGDDILSGIDEKTGEAKGVGIFSSPLKTPIQSGPTANFMCWGVEEGFAILDNKKNNIQYIILDTEQEDFIFRETEKNKKVNTYLLDLFIFPKEANKYIYEYNNTPYFPHIINNYIHNPGLRVAHPVVDIKNFEGVIALFPCITWTMFAEDEKFGYVVGGPGGTKFKNKSQKLLHLFQLLCPKNLGIKLLDEESTKLDYK